MQQELTREALLVFENDLFVVCAKPSGVGMHDEAAEQGFVSVARALLGNVNLLPVHRLDKPTSGLCVFAKTSAVAALFGNLFETKQMTKYYIALTANKPSKKQGGVIGDMEKTRNGSWKLTSAKRNPAITHFFSFAYKEGRRFIVLKPATGKTHQLRVALKALGAPIIGDERYGGLKQDRLYLHAYQLAFALEGVDYSFQCTPTSGELFHKNTLDTVLDTVGDFNVLKWPALKRKPTAINTHESI